MSTTLDKQTVVRPGAHGTGGATGGGSSSDNGGKGASDGDAARDGDGATMATTVRGLALVLFMMLYSSVVIGAGVLNLALVVPLLGYAPTMVVMLLVGAALAAIGLRTAQAMHDAQQAEARAYADEMRDWLGVLAGIDSKSPAWLSSMTKLVWQALVDGGQAMHNVAMIRAGLGRAGRAAHLLGLGLFVGFGDVGYILIGTTSLQSLAEPVSDNMAAAGMFAVFGVVLLGGAMGFIPRMMAASARRGAFRQFTLKFGGWLVSLAVLAIANTTAVAMLLFVAVVIASTRLQDAGGEVQERRKAGLTADHRVAVTMVAIMVALLVATGSLVLITAAANGMNMGLLAVATNLFDVARVSDWLRVVSLMIFAFLGTSIYLLCQYPPMFSGKQPPVKRVIVGGTVIVVLVYGFWTTVCSLVLPPELVRWADIHNQSSHQLFEQQFMPVSPAVAWIVVVTSFTFALLAISNACAGLTQALSNQIQIELRQTRLPRWVSEIDFRPVILLAASVVAVGKLVFASDLDITAVLGCAGSAGGGLLILLPLLYPRSGHERLRAWEVVLFMLAAVLLIICIVTLPATGAAAWVKFVIAAGFAAMVGWLLATAVNLQKR